MEVSMKYLPVRNLQRFRKTIFWGSLFLLLIGTLGAGSMKVNREEIQVVGRVYVMGNEPFTQVAIELEDGKVFAMIGEYDKELRSLRNKRLMVRGWLSGKTPRGVEAIEVRSFQVLEPQ